MRRRSLAVFLFAAFISVLGAPACAGTEEQRLEDLEVRVDVLEEQVEELAEEEVEEQLGEETIQQEQLGEETTQQERTQ